MTEILTERPTATILVGDALGRLRDLPDGSAHCCITSPPYWGLRAYHGEVTWVGGDPACAHEPPATRHQKQGATSQRKGRSNVEAQRNDNLRAPCRHCGATPEHNGMIGLEPTFEEHLENLVAVFREVRRVLRKDGTLWLNYGDAYASSPAGNKANGQERWATSGLHGGAISAAHAETLDQSQGQRRDTSKGSGVKPKDLLLMPARVALALQADGWWVRSEIVWHKPNPMPESVRDRPTSAHEKVWLLSPSDRYHYDQEAVRTSPQPWHGDTFKPRAPERKEPAGGSTSKAAAPVGANLRNVWSIATAPYREAHFATFPPTLVEPCIKAGTSEHGCCSVCGAPWRRRLAEREQRGSWHDHAADLEGGQSQPKNASHLAGSEFHENWEPPETTGWEPACECDAARRPCTVLDPFAGAGTVGLVAGWLQRHSLLVEISPEYAEMAAKRIRDDNPLLVDVEVR